MNLPVMAVVLAAACLHAGWNALLRSGADRAWSMMVMSVAMGAASVAALPLAGTPATPAGWSYAVLSGVLHIGYGLCLIRMYRTGDLGQTYPIARGSAPLLVGLGGAAFAAEIPGPLDALGLLLVCGGIFTLATKGRTLAVDSVPAAVATGCFIGAYSIADGLGVRAAGNAAGYIAVSNALSGILTALACLALPTVRHRPIDRRELLKGIGGGLASLVAYGAVIWAMGQAPLGVVSALRETSVVFAALIGWAFLHETLTRRRLAACIVIAAGAACIGLAAAPS